MEETPSTATRRNDRLGRGPRPLGAMARAVLAKNANQLTAEHVLGLSDEQRDRLTRVIVQSRDLSITLWKALLPRPTPKTGPIPDPRMAEPGADKAPKHVFCSQERAPKSNLGPYLALFTSPSLDFVAHIRIISTETASFGHLGLVQLASMPNLGILELIESNLPSSVARYDPPLLQDQGDQARSGQPSAQTSDRLMRDWAATKPAPFPELRVLRLWGCESDKLTQRSLEYAARFPKLARFQVSCDRIYMESERKARPDTGFKDGPLGAWRQVTRYMAAYGWHGIARNKDAFSYQPQEAGVPGRDSTARPSPIVSLSRAEPGGQSHDAALWAGRNYSFLADTGHVCRDVDAFRKQLSQRDPSDDHPVTHNIASLTLGVDRQVKSYVDPMRGPVASFAYVFVRTNEQPHVKQGEVTGRPGTEQGSRKRTGMATAAQAQPHKRAGPGRSRRPVSVGDLLGSFQNETSSQSLPVAEPQHSGAQDRAGLKKSF